MILKTRYESHVISGDFLQVNQYLNTYRELDHWELVTIYQNGDKTVAVFRRELLFIKANFPEAFAEEEPKTKSE